MPQDPTSSGPPHHTPTTCWCCGRRAHGIGMHGFGRSGDQDPQWLCSQCIPLMEQIRSASRFDLYEDNAVDMAIELVGPLIEEYGVRLDEWTESQVRQFVKELIMGFGDSVRKQVREQEVPF